MTDQHNTITDKQRADAKKAYEAMGRSSQEQVDVLVIPPLQVQILKQTCMNSLYELSSTNTKTTVENVVNRMFTTELDKTQDIIDTLRAQAILTGEYKKVDLNDQKYNGPSKLAFRAQSGIKKWDFDYKYLQGPRADVCSYARGV